MIDWLNNLHPTINALIIVLGSTTALLTLAAALRSCWRACRKLFRRRPTSPNKMERNERMLERTKARFRDPIPEAMPPQTSAVNDATSTWSQVPLGINLSSIKSLQELMTKTELKQATEAAQKRITDDWARTIMKQHRPMFMGIDPACPPPLWEEKKIIITSS